MSRATDRELLLLEFALMYTGLLPMPPGAYIDRKQMVVGDARGQVGIACLERFIRHCSEVASKGQKMQVQLNG